MLPLSGRKVVRNDRDMAIAIKILGKDEILEQEDVLRSDSFQPLHFIRGINPRIIHTNLLESLAQKSKGDRNLCYRFSEGEDSLTILAEHLAWDSNHFGFGVGKISHLLIKNSKNPKFTIKALSLFIEEAKKVGIKYIVCSLDARKGTGIQGLTAVGFIPIEIRAHYFIDLKDFSYPKRFKVRLANPDDIESLAETAANTENPYDRFFGDPALDVAVVKDLMRLWVRNSITTSFADGVLVPDTGNINRVNPRAFCTFKTHQESWNEWGVKVSQPVLAAVSPELSGWYVKLMSELSYYLRELGAEKVFMTTQLGNLAVIRTWEALNYSFGGSEIVCRWTTI